MAVVPSLARQSGLITSKELLPARINAFPLAPRPQVRTLPVPLLLINRNGMVPLGFMDTIRQFMHELIVITAASRFKVTLPQANTPPTQGVPLKSTDVRNLLPVVVRVLTRSVQLLGLVLGPPHIFNVILQVLPKTLVPLENPQALPKPPVLQSVEPSIVPLGVILGLLF